MKKLRKIFFILLSVFTFYSCDSPTSVSDISGVIWDSPDFQITPIQYPIGYPQIIKQNDSIYTAVIESQWQSVNRIEATLNKVYPGVKCQWKAACNSTATYNYLGTTFNAPIVNGSSYFKNNKTSTMVSFYKDFINDTVVVVGTVSSEDTKKLYVDVLYFVVKLKN